MLHKQTIQIRTLFLIEETLKTQVLIYVRPVDTVVISNEMGPLLPRCSFQPWIVSKILASFYPVLCPNIHRIFSKPYF